MWIPDHRVVYLPALVKDVEEMLALMKGQKRLQVRNKNQLGGGGLYVEDLPRFVDKSLIPPLARAKTQAAGKNSMRSKSMPAKAPPTVNPAPKPNAPVVKQRKAGEPPSPHPDMVIPPAPVRLAPGSPPPASSRAASLGPPPLGSPPAPPMASAPASSQLPSPRGSASESSMPKPRGSAHSLEPGNPLGGDVEAPGKGKGKVAQAVATVLRKRSASKGLKMPAGAVNRREVRSIDTMPSLDSPHTQTSFVQPRPPASADVKEEVQPPASAMPDVRPDVLRPPARSPVPDDDIERRRQENEEPRAANQQLVDERVQQTKKILNKTKTEHNKTNKHGGRQTKLKQQHNKMKHTKTSKKVAEDWKSYEAQ